jgi:alpha-tubulin suppressor-like RCC1 family protein
VFFDSPRYRISSFTTRRILTVAAGASHTLCIAVRVDPDVKLATYTNAEHEVWSWGLGTSGQLGLGSLETYATPQLMSALADMRVIRFFRQPDLPFLSPS